MSDVEDWLDWLVERAQSELKAAYDRINELEADLAEEKGKREKAEADLAAAREAFDVLCDDCRRNIVVVEWMKSQPPGGPPGGRESGDGKSDARLATVGSGPSEPEVAAAKPPGNPGGL